MNLFWAQCGELLAASRMPGLDGMAAFDQTCQDIPACDMNSMMVGLMHIKDVCCADGNYGGVYPGAETQCTKRCAAPFETFWTDCGNDRKGDIVAGVWHEMPGRTRDFDPDECDVLSVGRDASRRPRVAHLRRGGIKLM
jgi:hypothetical protein